MDVCCTNTVTFADLPRDNFRKLLTELLKASFGVHSPQRAATKRASAFNLRDWLFGDTGTIRCCDATVGDGIGEQLPAYSGPVKAITGIEKYFIGQFECLYGRFVSGDVSRFRDRNENTICCERQASA